jgi:hypothetical protein
MAAPTVRRFDVLAIAAAAVAIVVIALPTCRGPEVEIHGPAREVEIDAHGELAVAVIVRGTVGRLAIEVDGVDAAAPAVLDPPLPRGGACDDGCATTVRWREDDLHIGRHELAIVSAGRWSAELAAPRAPRPRGPV